jgi:hypothetical protein
MIPDRAFMWLALVLSILLIITTSVMKHEIHTLKGYLGDTCKLFNNLADVTNTCTRTLGTYESINFTKITPLTCYDDT